jgi:hypothetical protein
VQDEEELVEVEEMAVEEVEPDVLLIVLFD